MLILQPSTPTDDEYEACGVAEMLAEDEAAAREAKRRVVASARHMWRRGADAPG